MVFLQEQLLIKEAVAGDLVSISLAAADHYTEAPLDSALVVLEKQGNVIDSAWTNTAGQAAFSVSVTGTDPMRGLPGSFFLGEIYPNPFDSQADVDIAIPDPQQILAELFTLDGRKMAATRWSLSAGYHKLNLSMGHLPRGAYLLSITGKERHTRTLIKSGTSPSHTASTFTIHSSEEPARKPRTKDAGDTYSLRVSKDRYEEQVLHFTLEEDTNLEVLLERNNLVLLVVQNTDSLLLGYDLHFSGNGQNYSLTAPGLHVLKSGKYLVEGHSGTTFIEEEIEVASSDADFYFTPEMAEFPPEEEHLPGSEQLISEALANEEIDEETALIYKVFAAFNDPGLPPEFRGGQVPDTYVTHIQKKARHQYEHLSPEAQETIGPFLVPPMYRGSWWDLRQSRARPPTEKLLTQPDLRFSKSPDTPPCLPGNNCELIVQEGDEMIWDYIGGDNIKVWYVKPEKSFYDLINDLAEGNLSHPTICPDQMERTKDKLEEFERMNRNYATFILDVAELGWDSLSVLGLKKPLPDHIDPLTGTEIPNHGGDPRLDIVTLPGQSVLGRGAMTFSHTGRYEQTPAFIMLSTPISHLLPVICLVRASAMTIHELMHAFQFAYMLNTDHRDYEWFMESSANWAIDHVLPDIQMEHAYGVSRFMDTPHLSLNDPYRERDHAFLWPFFLARKHSPDLIRAILEEFESTPSLKAVDQVLKEARLGGFEEQWPKFALSLWNHKPYDRLAEWDDLTREVHLGADLDLSLGGATEKQYELDIGKLPPLSAKYLRFRVEDEDIRSVLFANGYSVELNWKEMEGFGKVRGSRQPEGSEFDGRHTQVLIKYEKDGWQPGPYDSYDITELPGAIALEEADDRISEMLVILSNSHMEQEAEIIGLPPEVEISNYANYRWEGEGELTSTSDGITEQLTIEDIVWTRQESSDPEQLTRILDMFELPDSRESDELFYPLMMVAGYDLESANLTWELSGEREAGAEICTYHGYAQEHVSASIIDGFMVNMFTTFHHIHPDSDPYRSFTHLGYRPSPFHMVSYTKQCVNQRTGEQRSEVLDHSLFSHVIFSSYFDDVEEQPPHYVKDDGRTIVIEVNYDETGGAFGKITGSLRLEAKKPEE